MFNIWLSIALISLIIEFTTSTFYLLAIVLGATLSAIIAYFNFDIYWQIITFVFGIGLGFVFIKKYKNKLNSHNSSAELADMDIGQYIDFANPQQTLDINNIPVKVLYRGAVWQAYLKLVKEANLHKTILGKDGIFLIIGIYK